MSRRIDFERYVPPKEEAVSGGVISGDLRSVMCHSLELKEVLSLVAPETTVFWVSNGNWSMHQLLMALLDRTGPADVMISSYAMSETPARILSQLKEKRIITTLRCVLDNRVDVRSAGSLQVMKSICDELSLIDTHAKVTLIKNDYWMVAVVGSANYTENKRYEQGVVTTCTNAYQLSERWILKALKDGVK